MKFLYTINKALGVRTVVGSDEFRFKVYEHTDGRVSINVKCGDGGDIITTRILGVDRPTRISVINAINAIMVAELFKSDGIDLDEIMNAGIKKVLGDIHGAIIDNHLDEVKTVPNADTHGGNRYQRLLGLLDGLDKIVKKPDRAGVSIHDACVFHGRLKPHLAINVTKSQYSGDRIIGLLNNLLIPARGSGKSIDVRKSDEYIVVGRDKMGDADCEKWRPMADFLNKWSISLDYTPSSLYYEIPPKIKLNVTDSHEAFAELSTYTNMYAFKAFYTATTLTISDISLK